MAVKKKYIKPELEEKTVVNEAEVKAESTFTKAQLLSAGRFAGRRDLLNALLNKNKSYTVQAVEEMIENYLKGKVK